MLLALDCGEPFALRQWAGVGDPTSGRGVTVDLSVANGLLGDLSFSHERCSPEEAASLLWQHYRLEGHLHTLATEKDDSFRVEGRNGERFVLKIANPQEADEEIDAQISLLTCLEPSGLPTPRIVPTREGGLSLPIQDAAGQKRRMRLMTYLTGTPLDSTSSSAAERRRVGSVLADLRLAMANIQHTGFRRYVAWDVRHLPSLAPLLDYVPQDDHRALLVGGLARFNAIIERVMGLPVQTVHNDFSQSNIIVDHDDPNFVTGIIDFGDTVETAIAIDVSTALLNQLPRHLADGDPADIFAEGRDLLEGYLARATLSQEELTLIPHLVMARVVARALITLYRAALIPANATYILRNTQAGWAQLDWFLSRDIQTVEALLV